MTGNARGTANTRGGRPRHFLTAALLAPALAAATLLLPAPAAAQVPAAQPPASRDTIITAPTLAPRTPLPPEAASASVTKFSFIAYGDTRGRHDGTQLQAEHMLVVEAMLTAIGRASSTADPIRFVVQSGDAVVNGSLATQLNVSYIPLINRLTQEAGVPYFLAVGNHDVAGSANPADWRRIDGLHNYFATNTNLIPAEGSPRRLKGYGAYAFGYGNTFFLAFDSTIPDDTVQFNWVSSQLAGLDRRRWVNVVAFFHHPAYSSGPHGGATVEREFTAIRARWMPLFRRQHVNLLLTGHEHLYEHWVERYTDATGPHRIDQVVSGGGGAPLYPYRGDPDLRAYLRADTTMRITVERIARPSTQPGGNPFHFVIVHVDGAKLSLEVIGVDWGRGFQPYRSNAVQMGLP